MKISQYSQENTFLIHLQALRPGAPENRLQHRCFTVKFVKFLRTPILKNIYERLLLPINVMNIICCIELKSNPSVYKYLDRKIYYEKYLIKYFIRNVRNT